MHHVPNDMPPALAPLQTAADGNCFPRTISYLLFKTQARYTEIQVRLIYEAVRNIAHYLDDNYVSKEAHNFYDHGTLPEQYAQYSDNFKPHVTFNMTRLYKRKVLDITQDCTYMGIWQIFQAANIAKRPICSVHPQIGNLNVREDLHRNVYCICRASARPPASQSTAPHFPSSLDGIRNRKARTGLVHRSSLIKLHPQNWTRPHFGA